MHQKLYLILIQLFYIKNDEGGEKDSNHQHTDDMITRVSHKQSKQIKAWQEAHPEWNKSPAGMDKFNNMVQTVLGGSADSVEKKRSRIRSELTEIVEISKNDQIIKSEEDIKE